MRGTDLEAHAVLAAVDAVGLTPQRSPFAIALQSLSQLAATERRLPLEEFVEEPLGGLGVARLHVITVRSAALRCVRMPPGPKMRTAASTRCAETEAEIIRRSPAGVCIRSRRMSLTSVISSSRRSRYRLAGILATMPMF